MIRAANVSPIWSIERLVREAGLVIAGPAVRGSGAVPVRDVHEDSRRCGPGDIFVARLGASRLGASRLGASVLGAPVSGARVDGAAYAADAVRRGAVAIVAARDPGVDVPWIRTDDPAAAAAVLADLVYDDPSRKIALAGITGTNGKTTVAEVLAHLLSPDGAKGAQSVRGSGGIAGGRSGPVGVIGTLGVRYPGANEKTVNTTPGATDLRRYLRGMVDAGCFACAMEVSSHALDQGRTRGLRFRAAAYTNLSGEHLDYHGSMERYAAAKARLFQGLHAEATAVVNAADPIAAAVPTKARRVPFAAERVRVRPNGTSFLWRGKEAMVPLVGRHNAQNAVCALELACALGLDEDAARRRLATARPARGRLEPVQREPFLVAVDYAHTDDALENALRTVREVIPGRVHVVFGCGGDRDPTKRPRMGAVAARYADGVFVTSDNPRSEQPERIVADVLKGVVDRDVRVLLDRRTAIREAIAIARPGDAVLIAGKGHEAVQVVGGSEIPFDDAAEARAALGASGGEEAGFFVVEPEEGPGLGAST